MDGKEPLRADRTARFAAVLLAVATLAGAAARPAKDPHRDRRAEYASRLQLLLLEETVARHELYGRLRALAGIRRPGLSVSREGNVAVIEDDGSSVLDANPFDLSNGSLVFEPEGRKLRVRRAKRRFARVVGRRLPLADDDVVEVRFRRGFLFPFASGVYDRVFVHSDGILTFGTAGSAAQPPSSSTLLEESPALAPLLADMDPSGLDGERGVFARRTRKRVVLTWTGVPYGLSARPDEVGNTFQVTLFADGRITFVYGEISAEEAVVGVSSGEGSRLRLVDYSAETPGRARRGAIAEIFTSLPLVDIVAVLRAFYTRFEDRYGSVVLYLDFPTPQARLSPCPPFCPLPFELNIGNDVAGIGLPLFDDSRLFGSDGRLRSLVQMGSLADYLSDPDAQRANRAFTPMGVLAHEVSHRWLAFPRALDENGAARYVLTEGGRPGHWSPALDAEGSINAFRTDLLDHGDGTFSYFTSPVERFSPLDQYLMGLRAPEEVPDFFYIQPEHSYGQLPQGPFVAQRFDSSLQDIVAVEGPREPATAPPGGYEVAFVLLARKGAPPSAESLDKIERFRVRFESFFVESTQGRGRVSTTLFED